MTDPLARFHQWLELAKKHPAIGDATAMCLATASREGRPASRMVLLKGADEKGLVFYTSLMSRKSHDLAKNPRAALCFYWMPMLKQVRIEGAVKRVSDQEADAYFASRPRESQLSAWISRQSETLASEEALRHAYAEAIQRFIGKDVPRPEFWTGWRVIPERYEFWQQGEYRLHDRDLYLRDGQGWKLTKLYP